MFLANYDTCVSATTPVSLLRTRNCCNQLGTKKKPALSQWANCRKNEKSKLKVHPLFYTKWCLGKSFCKNQREMRLRPLTIYIYIYIYTTGKWDRSCESMVGKKNPMSSCNSLYATTPISSEQNIQKWPWHTYIFLFTHKCLRLHGLRRFLTLRHTWPRTCTNIACGN